MTSTIVCVSEKIGDVQTACDCRCLNMYIADDVYPMQTTNDVLQYIARTGTIATVILCLISNCWIYVLQLLIIMTILFMQHLNVYVIWLLQTCSI